ncbi:MAG: DoxX family protein [Gammaproteobacteria bacterium]
MNTALVSALDLPEVLGEPLGHVRAARQIRRMNVLLWVLQVALAVLYLAGGAYKVFMFDELANHLPGALSRGGWGTLGVLEMLGAVLLVVPAAAKWMPVLTPLAAAALALETLALAGLYARYSLQLGVTNPMVWAVVMGLLAAFVAYGRYALRPPA